VEIVVKREHTEDSANHISSIIADLSTNIEAKCIKLKFGNEIYGLPFIIVEALVKEARRN